MSFGAPGTFPIPGGGAEATVSTGYNSSATSIVLTTGHGAQFPAIPFYLTWYNFTDFPYAGVSGLSPQKTSDPNQEIVLVTGRSSDTLTVVRGQQGTTASNKNTGGKTYKMRIVGPMWLKMHPFQPDYAEVTDKHVYEDAGASFVSRNDTATLRWLLEYDGLSDLESDVLDAHRAEAFGELFGFTFVNPRTGGSVSDVHYDESFDEDHSKVGINKRVIRLIKRPV